MATLRKKEKFAPLNKEICEEHPASNLAQNSSVPRSQEYYITQVSEDIERTVTNKLSQEFIRTKNRILCAMSRLEDFLTYPLIQGHSGTTPETFRNAYGKNQGSTPRVNLMLKEAVFRARLHTTPAEKMITTAMVIELSKFI